jgi:hypothetical protein
VSPFRPDDTPFEDGAFNLVIDFTEEYPQMVGDVAYSRFFLFWLPFLARELSHTVSSAESKALPANTLATDSKRNGMSKLTMEWRCDVASNFY